ncbi:MAG: thioredoxin [Cupriavidus sp.]|nr:thioredoxin [Cupriavidus sp.]
MPPRHPLRRPALQLFAALALLAGAGVSMAAGHLPPFTDVAAQTAAATQQGEPLVVLVSLPGCTYCETVRRNYLAPQASAGEITVRELDMTADTPIRDVDGTMTTAKQWARAHNISVAPTVLFLDRNGRNLAAPLRGMQPDFYGAYLEQAIDTARAKLAEAPAAAKSPLAAK